MSPFDIAIDVSDNNGRIDWPAVFASGVRIAFVKAMEGVGMHYPTWGPQSEGANRAGLIVIPYLFLRPAEAKQVVNNFVRVTGLGSGMAFALDWEGRASQTATPEIAEQIGEELAIVAGRKPIGYWGIPGSTPAAPTARMLLWPRWVPRYPSVYAQKFDDLPERCILNPKLTWHGENGELPYFAQYTAAGRVPGIQGKIDRSVAFFPTIEDALVWCGKSPGKPADAPRPVSATPVAATPAPRHPVPPPAPADGDQSADDLNRAELDRLSRG